MKLYIFALIFFFTIFSNYLSEGQRFYPYDNAVKEGSCSPLLSREVCWNSCDEDYNCPGNEKCCETFCGGRVCSSPVTTRKNTKLSKPGLCPLEPQEWVCSSRCRSDEDCRGSKKCCKNRCGALGCYVPIPTL